jgi:hypothetical protein
MALPGVVGELDPIMTAAADNFLALAVVGFMKLRVELAVDLLVDLFEEELLTRGLIGLERALPFPATLLLLKMFGLEFANSPLEVSDDDRLKFSFEPTALLEIEFVNLLVEGRLRERVSKETINFCYIQLKRLTRFLQFTICCS